MPIKFIRKSNRLPFKEIYRTNNSFFVTLCVEGRVCCLSEISNGNEICDTIGKSGLTPTVDSLSCRGMPLASKKYDKLNFYLTPAGNIVKESWLSMVHLVNDIQLEDFVVMPNHFHAIITFLNTPTFKNSGKVVDLSHIIAMFKSKTTNLIRRGIPLDSKSSTLQNDWQVRWQASHASTQNNIPTFQWQKSFHDHVIRSEKECKALQQYIQNNPLQWELDMLNLKNEDKYQHWLQLKKKLVVDNLF